MTTTKTLAEWLKECPAEWNMEYSEEYGQMAYFFNEENKEAEEFFNQFKN